MKCWICGAEDAATREHLAKASDLKALFGKATQAKPLFFNASDQSSRPRRRNVKVGSIKSDTLKFAHRICLTCNSKLTQPYDYAWEHASGELRDAVPRLLGAGSFRASWLFSYDTRRCMRRVHLYFTKLFGCLVVEGGIPIDIAPIAKALVDGQTHPHIYLAFGHLPMPVEVAGGSDVQTAQHNGQVAFATWLYHVGDLAVNVLYALPGEQREGLKVAWHPRMGAKRLRFSRFGD
ncbi:hypothetical protein [Burkholderia sp. TSV86]|uniref:hypothetical protein n=1 Tax=Burkholderia sp. TSV86 TaxID=1385594 RepID=UPI000759FBFC|nr:hypothetical protein [Burkholderia sp. TSV86]KVE31528.1 hypothetical protein WS68_16795 [Burkholderia sp. TSV86]